MSQNDPIQAGSIAIAGGGIIGTSIAWRLAQRCWHVTVFDQGSIGGEASWAGAGMLSPGGEIERTSEIACLALESRARYSEFVHNLEELSGLSIDYQECGALDVAYSEAEWEALKARAGAQVAVGIISKQVSPEDVSVFWPRLRTGGLVGALFYPQDAIVNVRELMVALAAACRGSGVSFLQSRAVNSVDVSQKGVRVVTESGSETFDAVVVAAGAWSNSIEVKGSPVLPEVEPVKGHLIGYQQPAQTCQTILRHGHTYLFQRASGLLICGSTMERVGFDRRVDPNVVASLSQKAAFLLPHLRETTPSEAWIGFRPGSEAVRMGRYHSDRLYLAYGHFRNGILLAPTTAERVSDEITANLRKQ